MTAGALRSVPPSPEVVACRDAVMDALRAHAEALTGPEILAVLAYSVGQCIAVQDQRTMTSEQAIELVQRNIAAGNLDTIAQLLQAPGGHA